MHESKKIKPDNSHSLGFSLDSATYSMYHRESIRNFWNYFQSFKEPGRLITERASFYQLRIYFAPKWLTSSPWGIIIYRKFRVPFWSSMKSLTPTEWYLSNLGLYWDRYIVYCLPPSIFSYIFIIRKSRILSKLWLFNWHTAQIFYWYCSLCPINGWEGIFLNLN